jgi:hypothetical protein
VPGYRDRHRGLRPVWAGARPDDPSRGCRGSSGTHAAGGPAFDDVTELFIAHVTDPERELLVRKRDRVRRGQPLARLSFRDPDIERRRRDAEAHLSEKQASLTLQEGKLRMARALAAGQLAAPGAVAREEANLAQAEARSPTLGGNWRGLRRKPVG